MTRDARFGLPLSLVEALRVDPSPSATALADLLSEDEPPLPRPLPRAGQGWRSAVLGLVVAVGFGAGVHAATPSLEGRWTMAAASSSFQERVTGPAPDEAVVVVSRDDGERLAYELVERRRGAEVARGDYDISFVGAPSTSRVAGSQLQVSGARDALGGVVIRGPHVGDAQALIRVRRTGRDTAVLEHAIERSDGSTTLERLSLVRSPAAP